MKKILSSTSRGTSLLIALGLITVIVLVSMGVATVVLSSTRESANVNRATEAFYAAQGALEEGLLRNQEKGAGFSGNPQDVLYGKQQGCVNKGGCSSVKATYQIQGTIPKGGQYVINGTPMYGVPNPGTGTAGSLCDHLNPDVNQTFYFKDDKFYYGQDPNNGAAGPFNPEDHSCNWNKIKVGESIAIPLYYTDGAGIAKNIFGPNSTFQLRVRTACTGGVEMCASADRYDLDLNNGDPNVNNNDTIISWQIVGTSQDGSKSYTLGPITRIDRKKNICILNGWRCPLDSNIYEKLINDHKSSGNIILEESKSGVTITNLQGLIIDFLNNSDVFVGNTIIKPVLKLTVVHSIQENQNTPVPYLEYQFLSSSGLTPPPTDISQTVTAEGFSGSFKQVLEVKKPQESGLLEYVIQQ